MSVKQFQLGSAKVSLSDCPGPDSGPGLDNRGRNFISLELGCSDECDAFSAPLLDQLSEGYETCSVLDMPSDPKAWLDSHRTARKRVGRAERLGYAFGTVKRHLYADDIFAINTSMTHRQGRPMSPGYQSIPTSIPDQSDTCPRHGIHRYGVTLNSNLVAYLWLYRSGDLALVSSILGHGDHLKNDVMYLLFASVVLGECELGGTFVYNRHDSGTDGLRYFKSKLGFEARDVEWRL